MNEVIFRRALHSQNPQAIFNVAEALRDIGDFEHAGILWNRVSAFGFGYDATYYTAVQQKLNDLGASPQLVVDGKWGPKSITACKAFQKSKGLVVDGIPGPKTLTALGLVIPVASSTQGHAMVATNNSDSAAYAAGKQAGSEMNLSEPEVQYVVAVARGEGGYGGGWGNPSAKTLTESKNFGITGYEGVGSNNWGAVQGTGNAGSFPHVDHDAKGKAYLGHFKKYASASDGFKDMAKTILGGGPIRKAVGAAEIKAAIAEGNLRKAVYAQHANGYFELNPESYLSAVVKNYNTILDNVGWPKVLGENGITPGITAIAAGGGLIIWGLVGLGIFLLRRPLGLIR